MPGADEVAKIASGVSASLELFQRAAAAGAQMLVVHHGLFWDNEPRRIGLVERERLRALLDADLSLVAYHLCLDAHPSLGNNAILCDRLGVTELEPFAEHHGRSIGFIGTAATRAVGGRAGRPRARAREPRSAGAGRGAGPHRAGGGGLGRRRRRPGHGRRLPAPRRSSPARPASRRCTARGRAGIHMIAAGHYATEVFGVQAVGELVARRFGISHEFIDLPNPV